MHCLYLHGFASGPLTQKGQRLGERLRGRVASYAIPDLEGGDFPGLTMDLILARARAAIAALPDDGAPLLLVGSSLGGYCAALLAAQAPQRVAGVLAIAPAFRFPRFFTERLGAAGIARWRATGALPWFHHGAQRELPLGVGFLDSCAGLPELPPPPPAPVAIVHGWQDETVPWQVSLDYAAQARERIALHLVPGDHRLTAPAHEQVIAEAALALIG